MGSGQLCHRTLCGFSMHAACQQSARGASGMLWNVSVVGPMQPPHAKASSMHCMHMPWRAFDWSGTSTIYCGLTAATSNLCRC
jgi:hypothetical protein